MASLLNSFLASIYPHETMVKHPKSIRSVVCGWTHRLMREILCCIWLWGVMSFLFLCSVSLLPSPRSHLLYLLNALSDVQEPGCRVVCSAFPSVQSLLQGLNTSTLEQLQSTSGHPAVRAFQSLSSRAFCQLSMNEITVFGMWPTSIFLTWLIIS